MFKCEYCGNSFKLERTIATHMCRNKTRYLQRDERHVKLGYKFFNDWYRQAMGARTKKSYDDFVKSRYYSAFVKFGTYIISSRVLDPDKYLTWLVKNQINIDTWSKDSVYNRYLAEQSKRETADRALERYIIHAEAWANKTNSHWSKYWHDVNTNVMVYDIKMGKISPWIFLSYSEAQDRLGELPPELLSEVASTIDLSYWQRKIDVNKKTVEWINEVLL